MDNRGNSTASSNRSTRSARGDTGGPVYSGIHANNDVNLEAGGNTNISGANTNKDSITSKAVDAGRTPGSWQGDAIRNLTGWFGQPPNVVQYGGIYDSDSWSGIITPAATQTYVSIIPNYRTEGGSNRKFPLSYNLDASLQVPTAVENRPRNVAYNWYIRAL